MLALACKRMLSCEARALLALVFAAALVVYVLTVQVPDAAASPRTVDAACRVLPSSRADAAYACTSVGVDACVSAGDSYACTATEARGNAMSPWSCSGAVAPSVAAADGREANGTSCAPGAGGTRPLECGGGTWCCDTNRPDGPCAWDRFSTNIQRRTACLVVYNATLVAVARALATNATWLALFSNQFGTDGDAAAASVVAARGTTLPCYWSDAADATLLGTPPSPRTPRAGVVVGTVFLALASAASILALNKFLIDSYDPAMETATFAPSAVTECAFESSKSTGTPCACSLCTNNRNNARFNHQAEAYKAYLLALPPSATALSYPTTASAHVPASSSS